MLIQEIKPDKLFKLNELMKSKGIIHDIDDEDSDIKICNEEKESDDSDIPMTEFVNNIQ